MSIRNTSIHSNGPEHLRSGYVNHTGRAGKQDAANQAGNKAGSSAKDRVEISEAGRAAANEHQIRELDFARAALNGVESLSPERETAIRDRMDGTYYQQPEVASQIAASVTKDLLGPSDPQ